MADSIRSCGKRWKKGFSSMLVVISLVSCTGCIQQKEGTETSFYEDYFRGDFVVTGEPILNAEIEIAFSVKPFVDSLSTEIEVFLPEGIELVQGDIYWKGDIGRDEVIQIRFAVKVIQEGELNIYAYVKGMLDGKHEKDRTYYLYFLTSKDSGQVSRTRFYPISPEGEAKLMMVNMILHAPPDPKVNEEIVLTFSIIASEDLLNVRAFVVLPEEFILVSGALEWTGDLREAEEITAIQVRVVPTEIGRFWFVGTVAYGHESLKYGFQMYIS